MNELVEGAITDDTLRVLKEVLYPGATDQSVKLVLSYCKAMRLDPMLKCFHIVPMWNNAQKAKVDTILPGIALHRIVATRTGEYAGISAPVFGPMKSMKVDGHEFYYPEFCSLTVKRIVKGSVCDFTTTEYWSENYATVSRDSKFPNKMWYERPRSQLVKCVEASALRRAFPESIGSHPTFEEMEDKEMINIISSSNTPHSNSKAPTEAKHIAADVYTVDHVEMSGIGLYDRMRELIENIRSNADIEEYKVWASSNRVAINQFWAKNSDLRGEIKLMYEEKMTEFALDDLHELAE